MATYPVRWRDRDFVMEDLTVGKKKAFCDWLILKLRSEAIVDLRGQTNVLSAYLDGLRARVWWVANGASPAVVDALKSPEGGLQYNRLLFGESAKGLTDDELAALVADKEAEQEAANEGAVAGGFKPSEDCPFPPANDYMLALEAIHEAANPKRQARPTSGSATTGTTLPGAS